MCVLSQLNRFKDILHKKTYKYQNLQIKLDLYNLCTTYFTSVPLEDIMSLFLVCVTALNQSIHLREYARAGGSVDGFQTTLTRGYDLRLNILQWVVVTPENNAYMLVKFTL